ncbi:MAG: DNA-binding protein WhiA [Oscillospiraceae bacterium]|nr:DNA-binding protein WhiA [Oscillospiraceae bacterium]
MTFCAEVKKDITENCVYEGCCLASHLYGMAMFGKTFSKSGIVFTSEYDFVAGHIARSLLSYGLAESEIVRASSRRDKRVELTNPQTVERMLFDFGYSGDEPNFPIRRENFNCENCLPAFLAGCFLTGGTVTDPGVDYHLEFSTHRYTFFKDFLELVREAGFEPKTAVRASSYILYFKNSEQIEDILTYMGACDASMKLMDAKIYRDIVNNVNRRTNCENANIDKTVNSAALDIERIRRICDVKGMTYLPDELRETAQLRLEHPELSFGELSELTEGKLTKSGISHRMRRIRSYADKLKEEQDGDTTR